MTNKRLDLGVRDGMSKEEKLSSSRLSVSFTKFVLWSSQRLDPNGYGSLNDCECRRTGTQCYTPSTFLLHDGKRIECAITIDTERTRELRCGPSFVCVQWRVTFLTARRADTSVMIVCHWKHLCTARRPANSRNGLRRQI
jgi:hypothetical protein